MIRDNRGFTLIELTVVIAALGIVAMALSAMYVEGMRSYRAGQTTGLVVSDMRYALDQITLYLREARRGTVTVTSGNSVLTLQAWNQENRAYNTYVFDRAGAEIRIRNTTTLMGPDPLCSYVANLRFDLDATAKTVTVTITSQSNVNGAIGSGLPITLVTRVVLRNY